MVFKMNSIYIACSIAIFVSRRRLLGWLLFVVDAFDELRATFEARLYAREFALTLT